MFWIRMVIINEFLRTDKAIAVKRFTVAHLIQRFIVRLLDATMCFGGCRAYQYPSTRTSHDMPGSRYVFKEYIRDWHYFPIVE